VYATTSMRRCRTTCGHCLKVVMNRILLDTTYLLCALVSPELLSPQIADTLADRTTSVLFSAVSIWEIAIKSGLGRVTFHHDPGDVLRGARQTGFTELPVTSEIAAGVAVLAAHHKDPFDRLLVAQALALPARLLTSDARLGRYSELVWVAPL
jgi:PIN domain nuclease of toxin-antitoxin system